ncbi:MAG: CHAD domain-containing protein [Planctomycetota bacterium]|jgi:CHAD domain-containing protein
MSYRIGRGLRVGPELQRIAAELMDQAILLLRDNDLKAEKRVHGVRKRCKMLRALFRLLGLREENRLFRDIGRELSGSRDAAVVLARFEELAAPGEHEELRAIFRERADAVGGGLQPAAAHVEPRIQAAREAILRAHPTWEFETVLEACVRFYHQGRKLGRRARKSPTPDNIHEWRKRVKDHWYHMRLLADVSPSVAGVRRPALDELADALGLSNDLVVLREAVVSHGGGDDLLPRIDQRRDDLVRAALAEGARLFEANPKAFADSLRSSLVG